VRKYQNDTQGDAIGFSEAKIFDLVQQVHDTPATDIAAAVALKERMKNVKNLLRGLRRQDGFSEGQHARLEDLQENLSDLQHKFSKKFNLPSKKRDLAKQSVLEMQLAQAKKHHQAIEEDMFAL